jgi:preprotein translocase subunit SecG
MMDIPPLSNVSIGTANALAYLMLVVVAIFLISGPVLTYYYWKKNKRMKAASPTGPA